MTVKSKEEKEDCHCGLDEVTPEVVCKLELEDAMKFATELNRKRSQIESFKRKPSRSNGKKEVAIEAIEQEIQQLQKGTQLAFQRFAKCEQSNPQVQSLNMPLVQEQLDSTWNMILNSNTKWVEDEPKKSSSKSKKGKKKK